MNIKGIIFDFGFTLFYFDNPSLERYFDVFHLGLLKTVEILKKEEILIDRNLFKEEEKIETEFIKTFKRKRMQMFEKSIQTKIEFPTKCIFKIVLEELVKKQFITESDKTNDILLSKLARIYHSCEEDEWKPYEKTKFTLETLSQRKDIKIGLLSNHPCHHTIKNMIIKHNFKKLFDTIVTSAKFGKRKPNPEIFFYTIEKMGLNKEDTDKCIMVGDEYADLIGAYRAGLQLILKERIFRFPYEKEINIPNLRKINCISEVLNYVT